jgi:hypothetical protein
MLLSLLFINELDEIDSEELDEHDVDVHVDDVVDESPIRLTIENLFVLVDDCC